MGLPLPRFAWPSAPRTRLAVGVGGVAHLSGLG
jgi:hypothetical protein